MAEHIPVFRPHTHTEPFGKVETTANARCLEHYCTSK
jgi:hypothetical protein